MAHLQISPNLFRAFLLLVLALVTLVGCGPNTPEPGEQDDQVQTDVIDGQTSENSQESSAQASASPSIPQPDSLYSPEAFRLAAHDGKLRVVEMCLESGLDVNEADPNGLTPLAMAAYNGHDQIVKLLIRSGATIDARDRTGKTPLIHAASGPAPATVQTLIDAGAEVNAVDDGEHWTALMMAAAEGQSEVVDVLMAAGAKKEMLDIDGESAADFARSKGHLKIAERLESE